MLCQLNEVTTMDLMHDKIFEFACLQDLLGLITCFVSQHTEQASFQIKLGKKAPIYLIALYFTFDVPFGILVKAGIYFYLSATDWRHLMSEMAR